MAVKDFFRFSSVKIAVFIVLSVMLGFGMLFHVYCPTICFGSCPPQASWCPGKAVAGVLGQISFIMLLPVIAILLFIGGPVSAVIGYTPPWLNAILVVLGIVLGAILMYLLACVFDFIFRKLKP
jgi:hypothetical protein